MNPVEKELLQLLSQLSAGPLWVHSDLLRSRCFTPRLRGRRELIVAHNNVLKNVANGRDIWTPAFNYDFLRSGFVDIRTAPCQVGPLGEYRRCQPGMWRTVDPVFSICGAGPEIANQALVGQRNAFGEQSSFAEHYRRKGTTLFYGAPFSSVTVLHYAEHLANGPIYRYDKVFHGTVVDGSGASAEQEYTYHVRPLGRHLDYDWERLRKDLRSEGILHELTNDGEIVASVAECELLVDFWVDAIKRDPMYLLDKESREWIEPVFLRRRQRFVISDFE